MAGPNGSAFSFALALANAVVWLVVAVGVGHVRRRALAIVAILGDKLWDGNRQCGTKMIVCRYKTVTNRTRWDGLGRVVAVYQSVRV